MNPSRRVRVRGNTEIGGSGPWSERDERLLIKVVEADRWLVWMPDDGGYSNVTMSDNVGIEGAVTPDIFIVFAVTTGNGWVDASSLYAADLMVCHRIEVVEYRYLPAQHIGPDGRPA